VMETLTPEELAESEQKIDDFMRRCGQEEGELGVGVLLERRRPPPVSQDSVEMLAMVEDVRTKVKRIHEYQDMTVGEIVRVVHEPAMRTRPACASRVRLTGDILTYLLGLL